MSSNLENVLMVPESICPTCGKVLNAASAPDEDERPRPGDISICFYCFGLMEFDQDLKLIKITEKTQLDLPEEKWNEIQALRRILAEKPKKTIH